MGTASIGFFSLMLFIISSVFTGFPGLENERDMQSHSNLQDSHDIIDISQASTPCPSNRAIQVVEGRVNTIWKDLDIRVDYLPQNTCVVIQDGDKDYKMYINPNMGKSEYFMPYDFGISIAITQVSRFGLNPLTCTSPVSYDDLREETFENESYHIVIGHTLTYHYTSSSPGSNPNPYMPEVQDMIKKVMQSIKIGNCQ